MPILIRSNELTKTQETKGVFSSVLLHEKLTSDRRLRIVQFEFIEDEDFFYISKKGSLVWLMPWANKLSVNDQTIQYENLLVLPPDSQFLIRGAAGDKFVVFEVPEANRFFKSKEKFLTEVNLVDWSTEPVLLSEFDSRQRVYLASPLLWNGIECVKGEMIFYPRGGSAPEHHHENAEHFQIVLKGSGSVTFDGKTEVLYKGDVIYFFENELHSFLNDQSDLFVFAEFFIPGDYDTVWVDDSKVCTWIPTGKDLHEREAARQIAKHVSGQGSDI